MPATDKTYALVFDLKRSTAAGSRILTSGSWAITAKEEGGVGDIVATGVTDKTVNLGNLTSAAFVLIKLDDDLDGDLAFKVNGSLTAITIKAKMGLVIVGPVTSLTVSNSSGNEGAFEVFALGS